MKKISLGAACAVLFLLGGCAATNQPAQHVPFPRSTPFDSREPERQAYLDGFQTGYLSQMRGGRDSVDNLSGPYREARRIGFHAGMGAASARKAQPAER